MKEFNDVRRASGHVTPCQQDPQTWDSIDLEYSWTGGRLHMRKVDVDREIERIDKALKGCRECPLLADCAPLAEASVTQTGTSVQGLKMDAGGVIAGVLVDVTSTGRHINNYLATGKWSSGVVIKDGDESRTSADH